MIEFIWQFFNIMINYSAIANLLSQITRTCSILVLVLSIDPSPILSTNSQLLWEPRYIAAARPP
jgi:hypothetical protein